MKGLQNLFTKMKQIADSSQETPGSNIDILSVTAQSLDWANLKATSVLNDITNQGNQGAFDIVFQKIDMSDSAGVESFLELCKKNDFQYGLDKIYQLHASSFSDIKLVSDPELIGLESCYNDPEAAVELI